jgi:hypothetical protein
MNNRKKMKWLLAGVALICLAPAGAFANRDRGHDCDRWDREKKCSVQTPEGGSTAIYLLGAGLTCFGAMVLRSRVAKTSQS